MALVRCKEVPLGGLHLVDRYSETLVADVTESVLCLGISLVRSPAVPADCLRRIGRHPDPVEQEVAVGVLRLGISGTGGIGDEGDRPLGIPLDAIAFVTASAQHVLRLGIAAFGTGG